MSESYAFITYGTLTASGLTEVSVSHSLIDSNCSVILTCRNGTSDGYIKQLNSGNFKFVSTNLHDTAEYNYIVIKPMSGSDAQ